MKKQAFFLLAAFICLSLSACTNIPSESSKTISGESEYTAIVTFTENSVAVKGTGAAGNGTEVHITSPGKYLIEGTCADGQIIADANKEAEIELVLQELSLTSKNNPPVQVKQANKVTMTLADGTENILTDEGGRTGENASADAAVYSESDLTIAGSGSLAVYGNEKNGMVSEKALSITGGTLLIHSEKTGLEGKNSLDLSDGIITVEAGSDGLRATNSEEPELGKVLIRGGSADIIAGNDGIQAESRLEISGGNLSITAGGGSGEPQQTNKTFSPDRTASAQNQPDTESTKGIKAVGEIVITGGTMTVDAKDDAIHANQSISITGGTLTLSSGNDGIHADETLTAAGGNITVSKSYEGLEAGEIEISGGEIIVQADDDGINAAGGDSESTPQGGFDGDASKTIRISGGYTVVNASGDGIDTNGTLTVTGGVTLVCGPESNADAALDYGISATIEGGVFVAVGSAQMAQTFSETSPQGSIMTNIPLCENGTQIALCDEQGNILASFTPPKPFQNILISHPAIEAQKTYTIRSGKAENADSFGYVSSGILQSSEILAEIEMSSLHYGETAAFSPGGGFGIKPNGDSVPMPNENGGPNPEVQSNFPLEPDGEAPKGFGTPDESGKTEFDKPEQGAPPASDRQNGAQPPDLPEGGAPENA